MAYYNGSVAIDPSVVHRVRELAAGSDPYGPRPRHRQGVAMESARRSYHEDSSFGTPVELEMQQRRLSHASFASDDAFRGFAGLETAPSRPFHGFDRAPSGGGIMPAPSGGRIVPVHSAGYVRQPPPPPPPPPVRPYDAAPWEVIPSEPRLQLRPPSANPLPEGAPSAHSGAARPSQARSTSAPPRGRYPQRGPSRRRGYSGSRDELEQEEADGVQPADLRMWNLTEAYDLYPDIDDEEPGLGLPYRYKKGTNRLNIPNPDATPRIHHKGCCTAWDVVWDQYLNMLAKVGACAERPVQRAVRRMLP